MTPTELRDTLTTVSDAVPVPRPDLVSFERRVARARRRRTATRVAGAAAAVVVMAGGSALVPDRAPTGSGPADRGVEPAAEVPLVVDGRLRELSADGSLGPVGPAVATLVGPSAGGVVVFSVDGDLARVVDGAAERLVPEQVRTAYVDGDAVVYETVGGLVRWRGIDPEVVRTPSAQTDEGRLLAAGDGAFVLGSDAGLVLHDPAGVHPLDLGDDSRVARRVEVAGGTIAVTTEVATHLFRDGGRRDLPSAEPGSLAPDGRQWATTRPLRVVDTRTGEVSAVGGPTGRVDDLRWAGADLLVVTDGDTLWRCPGGQGCAVALTGAGTLRLR